jgi:aspartate/methionine/tyrosine aminotransferase
VDGPFVFLGVFGAHEEITGGNQREFGREIGRHQVALKDSVFADTLYTLPMQIEPFALERFQSIWENRVAWNVSESGVHPLRAADLLDTAALHDAVLQTELGYPQTNGTGELRDAIAAMYPGAGAGHVQVVNGGSEANCVLLMRLVEPGDEIVVMMPNYMQVPGLARALGATVRQWWLREIGGRWTADTSELASLVSDRTRAIFLCNPNNPTGACIGADTLDAVCRIADRAGAWVVGDEIYRGAERDAEDTPSVWGRLERAVVTSGLSKAYGLPGLRIGWAAGPPALIADLWAVHDYTTIAPGALNDRLARIALEPSMRERLIARTRMIIRNNYPILRRWIEQHDGLSHIPPEAGAIALVRYRHPIGSTELSTRLRDERSVLVVAGDFFDMDGYVRIGFGSDPAYLTSALTLIGEFLTSLGAHAR